MSSFTSACNGFSFGGSFPKPLCAEEERKFLRMYREGTEEEREQAKQELVLHNLRLVAHIAKKYSHPRREQEELLSTGIVGLMKAVLSYDAKKSIRLATYASRCIENEILMSLRAAKKYRNDVSLYEPIGADRDGNEIIMLDVIDSEVPDFAESLDLSLNSRKALEAVIELSERERTVILFRYGLCGRDVLTQQEIAEKLGLSRSYVSRIETKALKKLRGCFED